MYSQGMRHLFTKAKMDLAWRMGYFQFRGMWLEVIVDPAGEHRARTASEDENTHLAPSENRSQRVRMEGWRQGRLS
jgi:hypothetical protein